MQITPMSLGFGAEISDFDLHHDRAPEDIARLQQAYADHHLLIFRSDHALVPDRQVEIAGWFGPVGANGDGQGRQWTLLDNEDAVGSEILPFHCDISYMEHPIEGLSLHPLALPGSDTSTTFVSNAVGWDAVPPQLQDELGDRKARHFYNNGAQLHLDWPALEYWHPIRMPHRTTGRPMLFVTEHHADRIEGMSAARGAEVLHQLFACLYAQERRYEHVWCEGDLLIWDNRAIQHARTRRSAPTEGKRILQRVALGEWNFMEQLERVRQAELQS